MKKIEVMVILLVLISVIISSGLEFEGYNIEPLDKETILELKGFLNKIPSFEGDIKVTVNGEELIFENVKGRLSKQGIIDAEAIKDTEMDGVFLKEGTNFEYDLERRLLVVKDISTKIDDFNLEGDVSVKRLEEGFSIVNNNKLEINGLEINGLEISKNGMIKIGNGKLILERGKAEFIRYPLQIKEILLKKGAIVKSPLFGEIEGLEEETDVYLDNRNIPEEVENAISINPNSKKGKLKGDLRVNAFRFEDRITCDILKCFPDLEDKFTELNIKTDRENLEEIEFDLLQNHLSYFNNDINLVNILNGDSYLLENKQKITNFFLGDTVIFSSGKLGKESAEIIISFNKPQTMKGTLSFDSLVDTLTDKARKEIETVFKEQSKINLDNAVLDKDKKIRTLNLVNMELREKLKLMYPEGTLVREKGFKIDVNKFEDSTVITVSDVTDSTNYQTIKINQEAYSLVEEGILNSIKRLLEEEKN